MKRLVSIVNKRTVVRASELYRSAIHPQELSRAIQRGLLLKIGRGLYVCKDFRADFQRQIVLACKRVPKGVICLESAVKYHGILPLDSDSISMAIGLKQRSLLRTGSSCASSDFPAKPHAGSLQYEDRWSSCSYLQRGEDGCGLPQVPKKNWQRPGSKNSARKHRRPKM